MNSISNQGKLIAIVGPSGVGKDSVMIALKERYPSVHIVQRVITRDAELGGEDFKGVTNEVFEAMKSQGEFVLDWPAHGLMYGIPKSINQQIEDGQIVIFNGSRGALPIAKATYPDMKVIVITASEETLIKRLNNRGRETKADIEKRLQRANYSLPEGLEHHTISNDGTLDDAVTQIAQLIIGAKESA